MAFQGEYFIQRYGEEAAKRSPPIRKMLDLGIPVGAGTDATRVASYNPWVSLYWLVAGKQWEARPCTEMKIGWIGWKPCVSTPLGSAKFSREESLKGSLNIGMYADMSVLSQDYLTVPENAIKDITSVLTLLDGQPVYAAEEFVELDQNRDLPISPDWSPVRHFGGYYQHHDCCHKVSLDCALMCGCQKPFNPWSFGCDCFAY